MNRPNLPTLLRQVRKAVSGEDYALAESLYEQVMEFPDMQDDLDIRLRYAYCCEKNNRLDQAEHAYRQVLAIYLQQGEEAAAASLQNIIDALVTPEISEPEPPEPEQTLDDATLMHALCDLGEFILLAPGDVLCREGEMPDRIWLLQNGSLTVHIPDYDEPDQIDARENHLTLVGELGFFTNQRRLADVVAATTCALYAVKTSDINRQAQTNPAFDKAMRRLVIERWAEPVLTRHTVFERVNDIDRMRIMHSFESVTYGPGETLIEAGEEHPFAYMMHSGCMFFMHDREQIDDGAESEDGLLMTSIHPGDMVHLGGLLKSFKSHYRVVTATPVQLLRLSQESFENFTHRRPWIIQAILDFSERPAHLQVMRPDEDYLWKANRHIKIS